jgi:Tfp pilus assembly protein PilN
MDVYGESPARPLFSASLDVDAERAASLASAELRLDPMTQPRSFHALVGVDPALPYSAALASACPFLFLPVNLLPIEQRAASSRALWIPTAVLGALVLMAAGALAALPPFENKRYLKTLDAEIVKIKPKAALATKLDKDIDTARQRTLLLDQMRRRSKMDIDVVGEMTRILPPPVWLNTLEIGRTQVTVAGEADQAAPLLKMIDASPYFEASEFAMQPMRGHVGESFRIRTNREAGK